MSEIAPIFGTALKRFSLPEDLNPAENIPVRPIGSKTDVTCFRRGDHQVDPQNPVSVAIREYETNHPQTLDAIISQLRAETGIDVDLQVFSPPISLESPPKKDAASRLVTHIRLHSNKDVFDILGLKD